MSRFIRIAAFTLLVGVCSSSATYAGGFGGVKFKSPGKFQQKVGAGAAAGAATGAAFGSFAGPAGSVAGAAGGAVTGASGVVIQNHAQKKWTGKGLQNWRRPSRW